MDACEQALGQDCQLRGVGARMSELAGALALAQLRKLPDIVTAMHDSKWRIKHALADILGLKFCDIPDPVGDSGLVLICILQNEAICRRFVDAVRAEGIAGPFKGHGGTMNFNCPTPIQ